jgi:uracil-DNA glycosylase family 4
MKETTCTLCDISVLNGYEPIQGDGNPDANIMFVSKNPSAFDIKLNVPLVSKQGLLFQEYLDLFNFSRDIIYITNAVKCRTSGGRCPTDKEIYNCRYLLLEEIDAINPKIIVLMGLTAIRSYFNLAFSTVDLNMESINGTCMIHEGRTILFMVHPYHAMNSMARRTDIYKAFCKLLQLYRIINPSHTVNFNL